MSLNRKTEIKCSHHLNSNVYKYFKSQSLAVSRKKKKLLPAVSLEIGDIFYLGPIRLNSLDMRTELWRRSLS